MLSPKTYSKLLFSVLEEVTEAQAELELGNRNYVTWFALQEKKLVDLSTKIVHLERELAKLHPKPKLEFITDKQFEGGCI